MAKDDQDAKLPCPGLATVVGEMQCLAMGEGKCTANGWGTKEMPWLVDDPNPPNLLTLCSTC